MLLEVLPVEAEEAEEAKAKKINTKKHSEIIKNNDLIYYQYINGLSHHKLYV